MAKQNVDPIKVVVTGAAGQIGYSLLPRIASGEVFGSHQPIILSLLEIPMALPILKGVTMELQDCSFTNLINIITTVDPEEAFADCDVAILVGGFPRRQGMLRKDLIQKNTKIFQQMGIALEKYAKSDCKVLVVIKSCPKLPVKNFTCLTRLDHNRALAQIALKAKVPVKNVKNVIIWGNHSKTQFPDVSIGKIRQADGSLISISEKINKNYLENEFISKVQLRGAEIIAARKLSSALSAANAICHHLKTWLVTGTKEDEIVSMGVYSNGEYGIAKDIIFSFPVRCKNGQYMIVKDLEINQFAKEKLKISENELLEELKSADEILKSN